MLKKIFIILFLFLVSCTNSNPDNSSIEYAYWHGVQSAALSLSICEKSEKKDECLKKELNKRYQTLKEN